MRRNILVRLGRFWRKIRIFFYSSYLIINSSSKAKADNTFYDPCAIKFSDIAEIWEYAESIERENFKPETLDENSMEMVLRKLQKDMNDIKSKLPS